MAIIVVVSGIVLVVVRVIRLVHGIAAGIVEDVRLDMGIVGFTTSLDLGTAVQLLEDKFVLLYAILSVDGKLEGLVCLVVRSDLLVARGEVLSDFIEELRVLFDPGIGVLLTVQMSQIAVR